MNYRHPDFTSLLFTAMFALAQVGCAISPRVEQEGQTLTSSNNPTLVLQIDPVFKPLKSLTFPLGSLSNVDRRLFVDAIDGGGFHVKMLGGGSLTRRSTRTVCSGAFAAQILCPAANHSAGRPAPFCRLNWR